MVGEAQGRGLRSLRSSQGYGALVAASSFPEAPALSLVHYALAGLDLFCGGEFGQKSEPGWKPRF